MKDNSAISLTSLLGLLFVGLKLGKVVDWEWIWVLTPFWIPFLIAFGVVFIFCIIAVITYVFVKD